MFITNTKFIGKNGLHLIENLLVFIPFITIVMEVLVLYIVIESPCLLGYLFLILNPYLFPLAVYRIMNKFFPLREGAVLMRKGQKGLTPWIGALHVQNLYNCLPILEGLLKVFPPIYIIWLRAWGSKVGKGALIQARVDILDRTSVVIGDNVFIAHGCVLTSHFVNRNENGYFLIHKNVTIGNNVFISGGSVLGPGVVIEDGVNLPFKTELISRERIRK